MVDLHADDPRGRDRDAGDARLGAVHSVVFGGFAPKELAARISDAAPAAIVTASGGIEPSRRIEYLPAVAEALDLAGARRRPRSWSRPGTASPLGGRPRRLAGLGRRDGRGAARGSRGRPGHGSAYILYTSGTTGAPKGVVRDNGGHAVALSWTMENIYDVGPGDVMWTASDVGWVVGHSYIVYGPLLAGATTVLYEGKPVGTPDAGAFWRVIQDHKVNVLFTAPTALRAIRKADPEAQLLGPTTSPACGPCSRPASGWTPTPSTGPPGSWASRWWTTGGRRRPAGPSAPTRAAWRSCPSRPARPASRCPASGSTIVDGAGADVEAGTEGNIVLGLPLPPGTLTTLWRNDERYVSSYLQAFEGYYATGDSGYRDEDGYLFVMGRTDDIINVAGHRLSTGAMEQVIGQHPAVAECAVIGLATRSKASAPAATWCSSPVWTSPRSSWPRT